MRHMHGYHTMQMHRSVSPAPFMGGLVFLILLIALGLYLLKSYGYYKLAVKKGIKNPGISFIPFFHNYMLGELTGDVMWGFKGSKWILGWGPIIIALLSLTGIGLILSLPLLVVYAVYYFMCLFKLYKAFEPKHADLYTVTSVILGFMSAVWIFVLGIKSTKTEQHDLPPEGKKEPAFSIHPYQNNQNGVRTSYELPEEQENESKNS